jgi:hypothetical protein
MTFVKFNNYSLALSFMKYEDLSHFESEKLAQFESILYELRTFENY